MTFELPLKGKTVVVTRAQDQQGEARALLNDLGASVLDLPALVIGPPDNWSPLDDALEELESFHWIVFSSSNGVNAVEERLKRIGKNLSSRPKTLKIAAVGRKTASNLQKLGVQPDFVPPNFVAESLIDFFPVSGLGLKILLPRVQSGGRTFLSDAFGGAGAHVVEVAAYESSCPETMPKQTVEVVLGLGVDALVFTSGKTVANTAQLMTKYFGVEWMKLLSNAKVLSIGPQTSISCRKYFKRVDREADPHDLDGIVNACVEALTGKQ